MADTIIEVSHLTTRFGLGVDMIVLIVLVAMILTIGASLFSRVEA